MKHAHERLGGEIAKIPPPNWIDTPDGGKQLTNPEKAVVSPLSARAASPRFGNGGDHRGAWEGDQIGDTFLLVYGMSYFLPN